MNKLKTKIILKIKIRANTLILLYFKFYYIIIRSLLNTKQKIVSQAITLYNAKGVTNVTSRHIAKTLHMSHGNLEYHFPNKEILLMAIYGQMRKEISNIYK